MPDDANAPAPSTAPTDAPAPSTNPEPAAPAPAPEAPAAPIKPTAEQVAEFLGTTPEVLADYQKYVGNNGGFDKAFANTKRIMANRPQAGEATAPQAQTPAPSPVNDSVAQPAPTPQPTVEGGFTFQELALKSYFEGLAQNPEYASIADEIKSGEVVKQLREWDIPLVVGNQVNAGRINQYLAMYAKTKPAPTPSAPVTTTPLAEPIQTASGSVTNMNEAMAILAQDRDFRAKGQPGHPLAEQANKFFDDTLSAQANRGKRVKK